MILKNKYSSTMEKITVTPQMEERILRNLSSKKEPVTETKKQPYLKWIRPVGAIAACFAIAIGVTIIYPSFMKHNGGNKQIQISQLPGNSGGTVAQSGGQQVIHPNPIANIKGVDELKKAVPFELFVPEKLPTGYKIDKTSVISGKLAQIIYSDGGNKITYRTAKGTGDISGDCISYGESNVVKIGDTEVTLKGNKSLISLATWIKDDYSYSLSFSAGIEKEAVVAIIKSMKKE
jgi:hypothetical protein